MALYLHPGDFGEAVATIGLQHVDPIGHFLPLDEGYGWWPAIDFDHDPDVRTHPVVTADTLDDLLSHLTGGHPGIDVTPRFLPGEIHMHHADTVRALLPVEPGRYLAPLGWTRRCRQTPSLTQPERVDG